MSDAYVTEKRNNVIDYMKGIAIILMVLRHAGTPGTEIVEIFHMALFFMVSGWCFSDRYTTDIKMAGKFILRKVQTLYLPFVAFNLWNAWAHNILLKLNIYTGNPAFLDNNPCGGNQYGLYPFKDLDEVLRITKEVLLFRGEYQLGGATWFIRVLFWVSILWCLTNVLVRKFIKSGQAVFAFHLCISCVLLMFSYYCSLNHITYREGFHTVSAAYSMIFLGYYLRRTVPAITKARHALIVFVVSFLVLECLYRFCTRMGWHSKIDDYSEPLLLIMTSAAGFFVIYAAAVWIDLRFPSNWLLVVGRNTMSIVLLHFLAFKPVNMLYVAVHNLPRYLTAAFPVLDPKWWFLYGAVGVGGPVWLSLLYRKGKVIVKQNRVCRIPAAASGVLICSLLAGFNIVNQDNIKMRYYGDYGYEWKSGYYGDGWLTDQSEMIVYNKLDETKYLTLEYFVIPELDGIEVTVYDEQEEVVYTSGLGEGNGTIALPVTGGGYEYRFEFDHSICPATEGMNEDTRNLTILIVSVCVGDR